MKSQPQKVTVKQKGSNFILFSNHDDIIYLFSACSGYPVTRFPHSVAGQIVAGREKAREVVRILMDNPDLFYACDTEVAEIDLKVKREREGRRGEGGGVLERWLQYTCRPFQHVLLQSTYFHHVLMCFACFFAIFPSFILRPLFYGDHICLCGMQQVGPVGHGRVTCISIYGGEQLDCGEGAGKILWVDNMGDAEGTLEEFKVFFESEKYKKVRKERAMEMGRRGTLVAEIFLLLGRGGVFPPAVLFCLFVL